MSWPETVEMQPETLESRWPQVSNAEFGCKLLSLQLETDVYIKIVIVLLFFAEARNTAY